MEFKCPNCGTINKRNFSPERVAEGENLKSIYCDEEDGGCGEAFYVMITKKTTITGNVVKIVAV